MKRNLKKWEKKGEQIADKYSYTDLKASETIEILGELGAVQGVLDSVLNAYYIGLAVGTEHGKRIAQSCTGATLKNNKRG